MFYKLFLITLTLLCTRARIVFYPTTDSVLDYNTEVGSKILSASEEQYVERPMTYMDWDN